MIEQLNSDEEGRSVLFRSNLIDKIILVLKNDVKDIKNLDIEKIRENNIMKHRLLHDFSASRSSTKATKSDIEAIALFKAIVQAAKINMQYCEAAADAVRSVLDLAISSAMEVDRDGTYSLKNFHDRK